MSADMVAIEEITAVYQETLTERMGGGPLPLGEALRYATQIATVLRDMHVQHLVYGAVSAQLIVLGASGASLRSSGTLVRLGNGHADVAAFGVVLTEMLRRVEGREELRREMVALGMRCQAETPDMQQVLITLRLLGLRARQATARVRRPAPVQRAEAAARRSDPEGTMLQMVLQWARMARQLKSLANFAAFALLGK
jgi:hypothetical protein